MQKLNLTDEERRRRKYERKRQRAAEQRKRREKARAKSGKSLDRADPENRCKAKTRQSGAPCPMFRAILEHPETGKLYKAATCYAHLTPKVREMFNKPALGGKVEGIQRYKKPTVSEVMKQMVEQEITTWIKPYFEALQATKPIVVGNGRHARIKMVPDHRTRAQAAEAVLDRLYGKAKTQTEITGADGGPIAVEVPRDPKRAEEVASILAAAGALPQQAHKIDKTLAAAAGASRN